MQHSRRTFLTSALLAPVAIALNKCCGAAELQIAPDAEEIARRERRSAKQVATELAAVYGQQLKTLSYIPSLCVLGRWRFGRLTGDTETESACVKLADDFAQQLESRQIKSGPEMAGLLLYAELARAADGDQRKRYLSIARRGADLAFDDSGAPRSEVPGHNEMSDAIFMACPLLATVGKLTGDARYFEAAINHLQTMQRLCLRPDGLYRHSPLCEAAWGRGNAFAALGMALALRDLPADHPAQAKFSQSAESLLGKLTASDDSMIHQVVDRPDSYPEFSATAMIAAAALIVDQLPGQSGAGQGRYQEFVDRSWLALKGRIGSDGSLLDVCEGTGKQKTLEDYLKRRAIRGRDERGGAMALLLTTELMSREHG